MDEATTVADTDVADVWDEAGPSTLIDNANFESSNRDVGQNVVQRVAGNEGPNLPSQVEITKPGVAALSLQANVVLTSPKESVEPNSVSGQISHLCQIFVDIGIR